MKTLNRLIALYLIGFTATIALASSEAIELGPANVSLDLASVGSYGVETGESSELVHDHDPKISNFQYSIYPATVNFEGTPNQVMIEVHKMNSSERLDEQIEAKGNTVSVLEHCIEQSDLLPRPTLFFLRADYEKQSYTIDGHEGILLTVDKGEANPLYVAAYSPDEKDGSGSKVCIVSSSFPWKTTKSIFDSVNTHLA